MPYEWTRPNVCPPDEDIDAVAEQLIIALAKTRDWSRTNMSGGKGVILALRLDTETLRALARKVMDECIQESLK